MKNLANKYNFLTLCPRTEKIRLSQTATARRQRFFCLLWHCRRLQLSYFLRCFLPTLNSTLPSSFLRWQRAVPITKKQSKKALHSNHHRSVYASMQIVFFLPVLSLWQVQIASLHFIALRMICTNLCTAQ